MPSERTKLVAELKESSFSEEQARELFVRYRGGSNEEYLDRNGVRELLFAVQHVFQGPLCIPERCIDRVLSELQLDAEFEDRVSWQDFKSFFVYLVQKPLDQLHQLVSKVLFEELHCDFKRCLLISSKATGTSLDMQSIQKTLGAVNVIKGSNSSALFFLAQDIEDANSCASLLPECNVNLYRGVERFPCFPASTIAHVIAKTIQRGREKGLGQGVESLHRLDEEYGVSRGISRLGKETSEAFVGFDERMGVSSTLKGVGRDLDEKLGLSRGVEQVLANEEVRKGMGMVGGWLSSVKDSIVKVRDETLELLDVGEVHLDSMQTVPNEEEKGEMEEETVDRVMNDDGDNVSREFFEDDRGESDKEDDDLPSPVET